MTASTGVATSPVLMGALVAWDSIFSSAELDSLERLADALSHQPAELSGSAATIRVTRVAWLARDAATENFYARLEEIVLRLNAQFFRYDLSGLATFQVAIYDGAEGGYFDWHKDYGRARDDPRREPRKLTLSLQLSDPSHYEGCELQVRSGNETDIAPKARGTLTAFPAYALHRVTPITKGTRKSLVLWAVGPELR